MTREEAIKWLKVINTKKFGWDEFALQESQREIRERCEQGVRGAIDMAIEALNNSIQMSNIQELQAENGFLKEMVKFYREQQTVEVVRCKDCRHRDLFSCPLADNDFQKDDDYCSWGELAEQTDNKLPGYDEIMDRLDNLKLEFTIHGTERVKRMVGDENE